MQNEGGSETNWKLEAMNTSVTRACIGLHLNSRKVILRCAGATYFLLLLPLTSCLDHDAESPSRELLRSPPRLIEISIGPVASLK